MEVSNSKNLLQNIYCRRFPGLTRVIVDTYGANKEEHRNNLGKGISEKNKGAFHYLKVFRKVTQFLKCSEEKIIFFRRPQNP